MNVEELKLILEEGEGYRIEFKEALSGIDREMVSFANASGGRLFIGVTDKKTVRGISIDNKLKSQVQDIANQCQPPVKILLEEFDSILIINVHEGDALPPITQLSGIIITGSPAMVTEQQPWMLALAAWLPSVINANLPLLGICFGHQILAQTLGGTVGYHPQGREIGTVDISLTAAGKTEAADRI